MRRGLCWLAVGAAMSGCVPFDRPVDDAEAMAEEFPPVPAMVVLDASGSMRADDAPGVRFSAAQKAVGALVEVLPGGHEVGLIAYGTSTGSSDAEQAAGCKDITTVVSFGALDKAGFTTAVDALAPSGYTPIGSALEAAAAALPDEGERAIVLISDGIDTCAPDGLGPEPCEMAESLGAQGLAVHTLGFKVADDPAAGEQLDCIAERSNGLRLDATNAEQLRTRLRAAFNPASVAASVQPTGYRGLVPGMSVAEARKAAPKLPQVTESGRVDVVYVDCTLVFEDGVLTQIVSTSAKAPTLDGLKVGDDIAVAERLYGTPGQPSAVSKNGYVTYPADVLAGTGYKVKFTPAAAADDIRGVITRVILCRCLPSGTKTVVLHPFLDDGSIDPAYTVNSDGFADIIGEGGQDVSLLATPSASYFGIAPGTYSVGTSADNAGACWASPTGAVALLCASGPWSRELRLYGVTEIPALDALDDPQPYGVELVDGSRWEARIGGSWGGRADGWNGWFWCAENCPDDGLVLLTDGRGFDREGVWWYAYTGELGGVDEAFPPPMRVAVKEVRFIG